MKFWGDPAQGGQRNSNTGIQPSTMWNGLWTVAFVVWLFMIVPLTHLAFEKHKRDMADDQHQRQLVIQDQALRQLVVNLEAENNALREANTDIRENNALLRKQRDRRN